MFIKELEKKTGLTRHTIRFYEKQGFLEEHSIRREENNYRDYSEDTVEYLMMLKAGQAAGFTLAELKEFIHADEENKLPPQRIAELIRQKMKDIDRKKAELDQMQTYLAYKLALIDPEEDGTAHGNTGVIPEMLTGPFSAVWHICSSRLKGGPPITLLTAREVEGKAMLQSGPDGGSIKKYQDQYDS